MKKKIFLVLVIAIIAAYASPVFARSVSITGCDMLEGVNIDVKIANAVHTVILAIKIVIPVLLVIFGMLDLFKGITAQKEDEMKKGQQLFIKRLVSAAIIFFVVTIVQLLISLVADDKTESDNIIDCASCFLNGANKQTGACNK